jgi:hypothetical protein
VSNFAILRTKKLTSFAKISVAGSHNNRTMAVPNADPKLSHKNRRLIGSDDLLSDVKLHIEATGAKLAKNSPPAFEVVLTASPDAMKKVARTRNMTRWVEDNVDFLKREFGDNLVSVDVHLDERTPHIHAIVCPVVKKFDKRCKKEVSRVTAKHYLGGKDKLQSLQDRYALAMKPHGLDRGNKGSKAKHETIKAFYAKVNDGMEMILNLIKKNKVLEENNEKIKSENYAISVKNRDLEYKISSAESKKKSNPFVAVSRENSNDQGMGF